MRDELSALFLDAAPRERPAAHGGKRGKSSGNGLGDVVGTGAEVMYR